ncbi:hypothetical protein Q9189_008262 [Teloschistes chrysophthalmus]
MRISVKLAPEKLSAVLDEERSLLTLKILMEQSNSASRTSYGAPNWVTTFSAHYIWMSAAQQSTPIPSHFVDTAQQVTALINDLTNLPSLPPSLYINLKGIDLSCHGTISIFLLFAVPNNCVYLLDVHNLGAQAFQTTGADGQTTLQSILESASIPKDFFDIRQQSDALYAHFGIRLAGIEDLQLMELRRRPARRMDGNKLQMLAHCILNHAGMGRAHRRAWEAVKEIRSKCIDPALGGTYQVFNSRPLPADILAYCSQKVQFMPDLWNSYHFALGEPRAAEVIEHTGARITDSQRSKEERQRGKKAFSFFCACYSRLQSLLSTLTS